jgi:hypothetical protein
MSDYFFPGPRKAAARYSGYLKGLHDNMLGNHRRFRDPDDELKSNSPLAFLLAAAHGITYPLVNYKFSVPIAILVAADYYLYGGAFMALATASWLTIGAGVVGISVLSNIWARGEDWMNYGRVTFVSNNGKVWRAPQRVRDLQDSAMFGHARALHLRISPWH